MQLRGQAQPGQQQLLRALDGALLVDDLLLGVLPNGLGIDKQGFIVDRLQAVAQRPGLAALRRRLQGKAGAELVGAQLAQRLRSQIVPYRQRPGLEGFAQAAAIQGLDGKVALRGREGVQPAFRPSKMPRSSAG